MAALDKIKGDDVKIEQNIYTHKMVWNERRQE